MGVQGADLREERLRLHLCCDDDSAECTSGESAPDGIDTHDSAHAHPTARIHTARLDELYRREAEGVVVRGGGVCMGCVGCVGCGAEMWRGVWVRGGVWGPG